MSDDIEVSKSGVWVDTQTRKVVTTEPVEGIILVAPGGSITPDVARSIAAAKVACNPDPPDVAKRDSRTVEDAAGPKPVEKAAGPKRVRSRKR